MRDFRCAFAILFVVAIAGCTPASPPSGRWQGAYESRDTMIVARLEIDSKGNIFLVAPDATDVSATAEDERAAIRRRLAEELTQAWAQTTPRRLDFDGRIFRKPRGIAPQLEWNPYNKAMTAVLYLGMRSAIRMSLRPVPNFNSDPWT